VKTKVRVLELSILKQMVGRDGELDPKVEEFMIGSTNLKRMRCIMSGDKTLSFGTLKRSIRNGIFLRI
jgi:hypothetical protein